MRGALESSLAVTMKCAAVLDVTSGWKFRLTSIGHGGGVSRETSVSVWILGPTRDSISLGIEDLDRAAAMAAQGSTADSIGSVHRRI
ncbi:hypothetical protein [Cutibacterium avidum]|uniref:hypothetical protein n=1 Tax=Cutibacterium avidum TaxID=33010 RepID=UPI0025738A4D|nr:hypothetical protein [Cutibacterium avidum]